LPFKPPRMTKAGTSKNFVLYADDDAEDLELVKDAFARYSRNVEVLTAKDGSQVISYLQGLTDEEPGPCLIILDINMPLLNGKDALKKIREMQRFELVPVVLFTTSSLSQDKIFANRYNAGFVTKPLDASQMEVITELFINHCTDEIKKNIRKHLQ